VTDAFPGAAPHPAPKVSPPLWRWIVWWVALAGGMFVFYVLLTPVWVGLRAAAWVAERRARRRR
jgi:hypothetical protein